MTQPYRSAYGFLPRICMIVQKSEQWIRNWTIYWIVDEDYSVGTVVIKAYL
jgi:hypothetical protein